MTRTDQAIDDVIPIEFAARDELRQPKRCAVQHRVARADPRDGEHFNLAIERGTAVGVGDDPSPRGRMRASACSEIDESDRNAGFARASCTSHSGPITNSSTESTDHA